MNYIVENEKLTLQYIPGNGAWTYQLIIPNTKDIKGKWGDLKVSGNKDGGNTVIVTLDLEDQTEKNDSSEILECFKDAQVLRIFERLDKIEQTEILKEISTVATDEQKTEKIINAIENLESKIR